MARYQSFAALGTILEASLQKKRDDIDKAFKALDVSMQSQLLKEKIAQQSWENEIKSKQFEIDSEIKREQLKSFKAQQKVANEKFKLTQWQNTQNKLDYLENEIKDLSLFSSDKFHASLGTSFMEGDDQWAEKLEKQLKELDVNEGYISRLLSASVKSGSGNPMETNLLIEELDQAVKQYNIAQSAPEDQKAQAQFLISPQQKELINFYLKIGVLRPSTDAEGNIIGVESSARFNNIFESSLISSQNLRNIDKEQIELGMGDVNIQSQIDIAEYESLESELNSLDLLSQQNAITQAMESITKARIAEDEGISIGQMQIGSELRQEHEEWNENRDKLREVQRSIRLLEQRVLGAVTDPKQTEKIAKLREQEDNLISIIEVNKETIKSLKDEQEEEDAKRTLNLLDIEATEANIEAAKAQRIEDERIFRLRSQGIEVFGEGLVPRLED